MKNYWGYRIDIRSIDFFKSELLEGRLRQGWGYNEGQDLANLTFDGGASGNLGMFNYVKKGDILLVPHLLDWEHVAVVEAAEDWNKGYKFQIPENMEDYGHIFPAKLLTQFQRHANGVSGNIRYTLRTRFRFWNINRFADDIESLLLSPNLEDRLEHYDRLESTINKAFLTFYKEKDFAAKVFEELNNQFTGSEWDFALYHGLKKLFPFYEVEKTGGINEEEHGTDILIRIPGIFETSDYGIAIQVKDYCGYVDPNNAIEQILKADNYWKRENIKIIDKIILFTKATEDQNTHFPKDERVTYFFANNLKELLLKISRALIGINSLE
jgi:hypothetical protein